MHACHACVLCAHAQHAHDACTPMHVNYACRLCLHVMHTQLCMHAMLAWYACTVCTHNMREHCASAFYYVGKKVAQAWHACLQGGHASTCSPREEDSPHTCSKHVVSTPRFEVPALPLWRSLSKRPTSPCNLAICSFMSVF